VVRGEPLRPPGGGQEAKDVIDAVAAADALEEKKDERKSPTHGRHHPPRDAVVVGAFHGCPLADRLAPCKQEETLPC
jgi:hypothetical protein